MLASCLTPQGSVPSQICRYLKTWLHGVRRFCGCINYVARFIPHLADLARPLHDLTRKGTAFTWEPHHTEAVNKLKAAISSAPVLAYFDTNTPVTLQCDASSTGLGAVLLQRGRPVAYASRALSDPESRYAQTEKELLAVIFALSRLDQMTYGRHVTVISDHKPLETILKKPLPKAPRRLQAMMLQLQRYSIELQWQSGKELHIANCLSRAHLQSPRAYSAATTPTVPPHSWALTAINFMETLPYAGEQLQHLKTYTDEDQVLQLTKTIIIEG